MGELNENRIDIIDDLLIDEYDLPEDYDLPLIYQMKIEVNRGMKYRRYRTLTMHTLSVDRCRCCGRPASEHEESRLDPKI